MMSQRTSRAITAWAWGLGALALCAVCGAQPAGEPPAAAGPAPLAGVQDEGAGVSLFVYVTWPGHDLSHTQVIVSRGPGGRGQVTSAPTRAATGAVFLLVDPGRYYVMALSDQNGDGKIGVGDGVGFYGVASETEGPSAVLVDEGAAAVDITIPISMKIAGERKLETVHALPGAPLAADPEVQVAGTLGAGGTAARYMMLAPVVPIYPPRGVRVGADGAFAFTAVPGAYQLIAFEDVDGSGGLSPGDKVGVAGLDSFDAAGLPLLKVEDKKPISGLPVNLMWVLDSEGKLRSPDGSTVGPAVNPVRLPGMVAGTVTRDGAVVPGAQVMVCTDEACTEEYATTTTDAAGKFVLAAPADSLYLGALLDLNGDKVRGPGDEVGYLCVSDGAQGARSADLVLLPGQVKAGVTVALTMKCNETCVPVPRTAAPAAAGTAAP